MSRRTLALATLSGAAFALFPLLRPWGDKTGSLTAMADAFASPTWVAAHASGMVGWVALTAAAATAARTRTGQAAAWLLGAGTACLLPYYGAETFGLHGLAQHAESVGDPSLLGAEASIRYGIVQMSLFGAGLLTAAAGAIALAVDTWRHGAVRWSGIPLAVLIAAYLPQFFAPAGGRVVHGLLLAAAVGLWAIGRRAEATRGPVPVPE